MLNFQHFQEVVNQLDKRTTFRITTPISEEFAQRLLQFIQYLRDKANPSARPFIKPEHWGPTLVEIQTNHFLNYIRIFTLKQDDKEKCVNNYLDFMQSEDRILKEIKKGNDHSSGNEKKKTNNIN